MTGFGSKQWHIHAGGAGVCLALTAAAFLGILRPIARQQAAVTALGDQLGFEQLKASKLDEARRSLTREVARLEKRLESEVVPLQPAEMLNTRLARITEMISDSRMTLHETGSGRTKNETHHTTIPISLVGSGTYSQCALFMHRLSEEMPDIAVTAFELSGNPREPGAAAAFQLELAWYTAQTVAGVDEPAD